MSIIKHIHAREVLDSRGNPTVEVDLTTKDGLFRAMVPSGASTGTHEALELRDKDKRYGGKGVLKAVKNVNELIKKTVEGMDCTKQDELDQAMLKLDGTEHKEKLGANAILAVSMAACKAAASAMKMPLYEYIGKLSGSNAITLPVTQMNVINGGKHAGQDNSIQEHMLLPIGAKNVKQAIQMCAETYHTLKKMLKKKFGSNATLLADEGGFAPPIKETSERLELMTKAIEQAGYKGKIALGLDCAASEFYEEGIYTIGEKRYNSAELVDYYEQLAKKFNLISIEDGMAEDDWEGWTMLTNKLGKDIQIIGDDLLVTNTIRIKKAIEMEACNSLLLKVNQIGSVTEAINAARLAQEKKWTVVVSHRSGETEDSFIADLVVGLDASQSKFGAPARSERNAKYNELLRIEEQLGKKAKYAGKGFRK